MTAEGEFSDKKFEEGDNTALDDSMLWNMKMFALDYFQ